MACVLVSACDDIKEWRRDEKEATRARYREMPSISHAGTGRRTEELSFLGALAGLYVAAGQLTLENHVVERTSTTPTIRSYTIFC